jgi:hypothetical protein
MSNEMPIPTRRVFLLLCRDDQVRWLAGKAWKCFVLRSQTELDFALSNLEPYERHFDADTREVHLLIYRDGANEELAGADWDWLPSTIESVWIGYTFKKRSMLDEMVADIESDKSVWSREAVPKYTLSVRLPNSALKSKHGRVLAIRQVELPVTALSPD